MAVVDGTELRDQIAEDYAKNAKRLGGELDMESARALAINDLHLVDALDREAKPQSLPSKSQIIEEPEPLEGKEDVVQAMAGDVGGRFEKRGIKDAPARETLAVVNPQKRINLTARISLLCSQDKSGVAMYPRFAKAVAESHANWNLNCRDYRLCRTQEERDRMFFRALEDICDKSNSVLPNWWVK